MNRPRPSVSAAPRCRCRRSRGTGRFGVALVELAICLPILVVILLATVETCAMLQLKQNLAVTAYEGARVGIIPGVEAGTVQLQCQMLLDDRSISGYTVSMDPGDLATLNTGDNFTVTVTAECASNSVFGGVFYEDKIMTETVVMRAE